MIDERSSSIFDVHYCEYWASLILIAVVFSRLNNARGLYSVFSRLDTASTGLTLSIFEVRYCEYWGLLSILSILRLLMLRVLGHTQ